MGESGHVVISPGMGEVRPLFEKRGMKFNKSSESSTPYVYEVTLDASSVGDQGWNLTEQYAGSGPVPGGAGTVPDIVKAGANGRTRKRDIQDPRDIGIGSSVLEAREAEPESLKERGTSEEASIEVSCRALLRLLVSATLFDPLMSPSAHICSKNMC